MKILTSCAQRILGLIDLTSLNDQDTHATITQLCQQAKTTWGNVAAVCVYPRFVPLAKTLLKNSSVKIATVCNFPAGNDSLAAVICQIEQAKIAGVDEIDLVMPYQDYLAGKKSLVANFVTECKKMCGDKLLKIILESGVLMEPAIIAEASKDMIVAGADFIKTSTGKIPQGASLTAASAILQTIASLQLARSVGFKASGGIRSLEEANAYLQLADSLLGPQWANAENFRFGASVLLTAVTTALQQQ